MIYNHIPRVLHKYTCRCDTKSFNGLSKTSECSGRCRLGYDEFFRRGIRFLFDDYLRYFLEGDEFYAKLKTSICKFDGNRLRALYRPKRFVLRASTPDRSRKFFKTTSFFGNARLYSDVSFTSNQTKRARH